MFKKYIEYLKNNPEKYWFKKKIYGWGWFPVKWQGWLVIGIFIIFLILNSLGLGAEPSKTELIDYFIKIFFLVIVLLIICYRTGEKPCWQWGIPKETKPK